MDLASLIVVAAGSSVLTAIVTVVGNGIFGWAKGRADTDHTEEETRGLTLTNARDQLQQSIESNNRCEQRLKENNTRLLKRDEATYALLEVLDRILPPHLTAEERIELSSATQRMRQAMYT